MRVFRTRLLAKFIAESMRAMRAAKSRHEHALHEISYHNRGLGLAELSQ